jgi:hypothetical protein
MKTEEQKEVVSKALQIPKTTTITTKAEQQQQQTLVAAIPSTRKNAGRPRKNKIALEMDDGKNKVKFFKTLEINEKIAEIVGRHEQETNKHIREIEKFTREMKDEGYKNRTKELLQYTLRTFLTCQTCKKLFWVSHLTVFALRIYLTASSDTSDIHILRHPTNIALRPILILVTSTTLSSQ